jgi:hypothetical protein
VIIAPPIRYQIITFGDAPIPVHVAVNMANGHPLRYPSGAPIASTSGALVDLIVRLSIPGAERAEGPPPGFAFVEPETEAPQ